MLILHVSEYSVCVSVCVCVCASDGLSLAGVCWGLECRTSVLVDMYICVHTHA